MTNEEIFNVWAPDGGRWSPWVKPVLFACMEREPTTLMSDWPERDLSWAPATGSNVAVVLDLPGAEGVVTGVALSALGYRPVPLYNAVPGPTGVLATGLLGGSASLIDVHHIAGALWHGTARLQATGLAEDAPPVFLLDAHRRGEGRFPTPGRFDNRSVSFTTDFPSANFLRAHGIQRALLAQTDLDIPQTDLAHTLRRWQEGGIAIELKRLDLFSPSTPIEVPKPSGFGSLWQRALTLMGLRRHGLGGFGGFVPEPSSG